MVEVEAISADGAAGLDSVEELAAGSAALEDAAAGGGTEVFTVDAGAAGAGVLVSIGTVPLLSAITHLSSSVPLG